MRTSNSRFAIEDVEDEEESDLNDREEEDVVTPYSICNQTNVRLLVKRLNNGLGSPLGEKGGAFIR